MLTYDYYAAVLQALDLISQGHTISQACDKCNLTVASYERMTMQDPNLREMRIDAERRGHDALRDALINIDNHTIHGQANPQMAKVISDNIKWVLSKSDPARFGDRLEVKHEITMDKAIVAALMRSKERSAGLLIDLQPVPVEDVQEALIDEDDDALLQRLLS